MTRYSWTSNGVSVRYRPERGNWAVRFKKAGKPKTRTKPTYEAAVEYATDLGWTPDPAGPPQFASNPPPATYTDRRPPTGNPVGRPPKSYDEVEDSPQLAGPMGPPIPRQPLPDEILRLYEQAVTVLTDPPDDSTAWVDANQAIVIAMMRAQMLGMPIIDKIDLVHKAIARATTASSKHIETKKRDQEIVELKRLLKELNGGT